MHIGNKKKAIRKIRMVLKSWSDKRGSNPRPSAWEANALPTELLSPVFREGKDRKEISIDKPLKRKIIGDGKN